MAHWHVEMKSMLIEDKKEWSKKIKVGMILSTIQVYFRGFASSRVNTF